MLGGVQITDLDGNIGRSTKALSDGVCGLIFDTSKQATTLWTKGRGVKMAENEIKDAAIIQLVGDYDFKQFKTKGIADAAVLGAEATVDEKAHEAFWGIALYHMEKFFEINPNGTLYVTFAKCTNWDVVSAMQRVADGAISQFGIWTEQSLLKQEGAEVALQLVKELNKEAVNMANDMHAPAVIVLNANVAKIEGKTANPTKVSVSELPNCRLKECRYVSVVLGQEASSDVHALQANLTTATPVGNVGIALGVLSINKVSDNIGAVKLNPIHKYLPVIEFGFGDATIVNSALTSSTPYEKLTVAELNTLDEKGYIFPIKYASLTGQVFFNGDATCANGDYSAITRNRVINKSRRIVRALLLPYVNARIRVNPTNGQIAVATITEISNTVRTGLTAMVQREEVSDIAAISIPVNQNILQNDMLSLSYSLIPFGYSKVIKVEDGFAISQSK